MTSGYRQGKLGKNLMEENIMRKIVMAVVVVLSLLMTTALAAVNLRGGIKMGMSPTQVKNLEREISGNRPDYDDESYNGGWYLTYEALNFMKRDYCDINYSFTKDQSSGKYFLTEIEVDGLYYPLDEVEKYREDPFDIWYPQFEKKFGEPVFTSDDGGFFRTSLGYVSTDKGRDTQSIDLYAQWLVDNGPNQGSIFIELSRDYSDYFRGYWEHICFVWVD